MTTERDELSELIFEQDMCQHKGDARDVATAILAAGYRRPQQITTVEELDALPAHTVIRTDNGEVFERQPEGPYRDGPHDWQSTEGTFWNGETFVFPATVLHVGGAK